MPGRLLEPVEPLLAQCTGAAPCELPTGLPWYFGLGVAVVWLAAVAGVLLLARRFLVRRIRRRRETVAARAIDRTTSRTDVEPW